MAAGWGDAFRVLRNRNYRLLLVGELVSVSGSMMQSTALAWLVYRSTGSTALLGAILFLTGIPLLVIGPWAGVIVDRFSVKRVFLVTEALCLLHAIALFWVTRTGHATAPVLLAFAGVLGVIQAVDLPAQQSLIVAMTSAADRQQVLSMNAVLLQITRVVGPSAAGFVVAAVGEATCFLLNGATFAAFMVCVALVPAPPVLGKRLDSAVGQLVDGIRYLRRAPDVADLVLSVGLSNFVAVPATLLLPYYAEHVMKVGSRGFGVLSCGVGVGAVLGTLLLARYSPSPRRAVLLESAFVAIGATLSAFAWSTRLELSLILLGILGFVLIPRNVLAFVRIQSLVPDQYRVRITSLNTAFNVGLIPIANFAGGELAAVVEPQLVVALAGVACLGVALWFRMRRTARLRG